MGSKGNPSMASAKPCNVLYRLGLVTEPSLGSAEGQVAEPSHSCDTVSTEAVVASRE
ncbi:hypothetical protein NC651_013682 [Populus alba x Populus x berolinensis]|nr:hypothetical protein NC651_013682 [Populus alba x Populus x berolinensis]